MTLTRVLTAAVLVPVVVCIMWWGSTGLVAAILGLTTLLALLEFFAMAEKAGSPGYRTWTGVCALAVLFQQWAATETESRTLDHSVTLTRAAAGTPLALDFILVAFVIGTAAIALGNRRPLTEVLPAIGISAAALVFVVLPLSFIVRLHGISRIGPKLLVFVLVLVWVGDTLAYFVGRAVGRLPMAAHVSPKKTWEGAAANLVGSLIVAVIFARWLPIDPVQLLAMAGLGNIAGQIGDLLESAYKRSAGVKDSSRLLPGHGGVLDRIDALVLAAPVVWYYFQWAVIRRA